MIQRWLTKDISLNAILMSGRSCQLPGLKELISDSLPVGKRPFEIDFVRPGSFILTEPHPLTTTGSLTIEILYL